jgi:hypothetical protein
MKAPSTEQRSREPGREAPPRRAGREGGRRRHRAEPSREAGPTRRAGREGGRPEAPPCRVEQGGWTAEGPRGQGGLVAKAGSPALWHGRSEADWRSGPSGGHRRPTGGSRSKEGAEVAEWRTPAAGRRQTGGGRA